MAVFLKVLRVVPFKELLFCVDAIIPLCCCFCHLVSEVTPLCVSLLTEVTHDFFDCVLFWSVAKLLFYIFLLNLEVLMLIKLCVNLRMLHGTYLRCISLGGAAWMGVSLVLVTITVEVSRSRRLWGTRVLCHHNLTLCLFYCAKWLRSFWKEI